MRLIEQHEIPARRLQQNRCVLLQTHHLTTRQKNGLRESLGEICRDLYAPIWPYECGLSFKAWYDQATLFAQLSLPLPQNTRGNEQQHAAHASTSHQPPKDH